MNLRSTDHESHEAKEKPIHTRRGRDRRLRGSRFSGPTPLTPAPLPQERGNTLLVVPSDMPSSPALLPEGEGGPLLPSRLGEGLSSFSTDLLPGSYAPDADPFLFGCGVTRR